MNIFFCSDTHLGHWRICQYCNRPFKTLIEMDSTIIKNINERVNENDTLFHLGDFCFTKSSEASEAPKKAFDYYRNQIKCKNIIFIRGNHDSNNTNKTCIESSIIKHGGRRIFLVHNPEFCNVNCEINLVGHVHNNWEIMRVRKGMSFTDCINIGTDVWGYYPVTWNEINQRYQKWLKEQNG